MSRRSIHLPTAPPPVRRLNRVRRNELCPCGSGHKFKRCCSSSAAQPGVQPRLPGVSYIDTGEHAVRWVICDDKGTSFFSDKDNRIIVFTDKMVAVSVAGATEFSDQSAGEVNVAGIGEIKFAHLRDTLPYVEAEDVETALALVRERIELKLEELEAKETE
jgi:hypothetical protein